MTEKKNLGGILHDNKRKCEKQEKRTKATDDNLTIFVFLIR
jgi:hypothetical protein